MKETKILQLNEVFSLAFPGEKSNIEKFALLENHIASEGGRLEGMKYSTFNEWMNGKRKAKKPVKDHIIRVFDSFIRHNSGTGSL